MAAEVGRKLSVTSRFPGRNLLQRLPDTLLEGCAAQIEGQPGGVLWFLQLADDCLQPLTQTVLIALQLCRGKARAQLVFQRCWIVAEQQGADTFVAAGDQQQAERAGRQSIAQGFARTFASALGRRQRLRVRIGCPRAGVAGGEGGVEYRIRIG